MRATILKLLAFCQSNNWAGYDPYDALNSKLVKGLPLADSRFARIAFTQILKRSPLNIRPLLLIPKVQNAKALALFLTAFIKLERNRSITEQHLVPEMVERLVAIRSQGLPYWCWGYSFPWQTRTILVPAGAPNLVCTAFVANALLDAYEERHNSACLTMAVSAAEYLLNELYWSREGIAGFSYPQPGRYGEVHNANLLGASLLCRVYSHTGDKKFLDPALRVAEYSASKQHQDGGWYYGEAHSQRWIDNFHTGYNLCALRGIALHANTTRFDSYISRGFEFYRSHFLLADGAVRYFHDRIYPIDIHAVAQSIITLVTFQDLDRENVRLARLVLQWTLNHMWDVRGFFYYRLLRFGTIRTQYMRWSQAWMLLAMSTLICELDTTTTDQRHSLAEIELRHRGSIGFTHHDAAGPAALDGGSR